MKISIKEINRLAIPAIIAGIAEPLISLVDTAIIGHLGTAELAGVGIATSLFTLIIWVLAQTKSAVSAIVSQHLGKNQLHRVKTLIPQAILLNIFLGLLFYLTTSALSSSLLSLFNAKGAVLQFAEEYYALRAIGYPLTLATFGIFGVFRGLQNTSWAMAISMIGGVVNIILDIVLVYGIDGIIPSLGVKGAAIASLAAQLIMFLLAIYYLLTRTNFGIRITTKINPELSRLLSLSLDLFVRTIALQVAYFLGTRFSAGYGDEYVAAHTIVMNIWLFSAFFIDGYSAAGNAIAGKLLGEDNRGELYSYGIRISKITVLISLGLSAVYIAGYNIIGKLFTTDEAVLSAYAAIFWLAILSQPINGIAFALDGIFKGLAETKYLRNTLIGATFFGFVPVIYLLDYLGLHIYSVWIAFFIWMIARAGTLVVKFKIKYGS